MNMNINININNISSYEIYYHIGSERIISFLRSKKNSKYYEEKLKVGNGNPREVWTKKPPCRYTKIV